MRLCNNLYTQMVLHVSYRICDGDFHQLLDTVGCNPTPPRYDATDISSRSRDFIYINGCYAIFGILEVNHIRETKQSNVGTLTTITSIYVDLLVGIDSDALCWGDTIQLSFFGTPTNLLTLVYITEIDPTVVLLVILQELFFISIIQSPACLFISAVRLKCVIS